MSALIPAVVCSLISLALLIRNNRVFRYRQALLARISEAAQADIARGDFDWNWRYDELNAVSYDRMLLVPKPFASFYPRDPARAER